MCGVETASRGRAERFEPPHIKPAAKGPQLLAMQRDFVNHDGSVPRGSSIPRNQPISHRPSATASEADGSFRQTRHLGTAFWAYGVSLSRERESGPRPPCRLPQHDVFTSLLPPSARRFASLQASLRGRPRSVPTGAITV